MLEAARLASFWGNVQALRAIVMFRGESPPEKWDALVAPLGTSQLKHAPVVILWYWVEEAIFDRKTGHATQGDRLHELTDARVMGLDPSARASISRPGSHPVFQAELRRPDEDRTDRHGLRPRHRAGHAGRL